MQPVTSVGEFPSTVWGQIVRAGAGDSPEALADLCGRYWYPVYAYIRRQVRDAHKAEDLTQGFFGYVLEKEVIAQADPSRGRFRSFLLSCCKHYLLNRDRYERAGKRGGGRPVLSLDFDDAGRRYDREPADPADPEALFRRRWAFTLLEETFAALEGEYRAAGHGALFARLKPALAGDPDAAGYAAIGQAVGMTENAVKKAAQRLRERFGAELRRRVADTVDGPAAVAEEIQDLFAAVG